MTAGAPTLACYDEQREIDRMIDGEQTFQQTAQALELWLATQAQQGVPELVLIGLLRGYADRIEAHGFVPRSWATDTAPQIDTP